MRCLRRRFGQSAQPHGLHIGVLAAIKPRAWFDDDVDVRGYTARTVKVLIINESAIVFAGRQWLCNEVCVHSAMSFRMHLS